MTHNKPKDRNFLQKLQDKVSPQKAMMGMVSGMLPGLAKKLADMSRPKEEGGLLNPGDDKIAYLITEHAGEIKMMLVPIQFDQATGKRILGNPLQNSSLQEILSDGKESES